MNTVTCFDISEPVLHISSGKFTARKHWRHKHMYHDGNFEIIIMIKGTLYLQVDDQYYQVREREVFALPPYHHLQGYQDSPEDTQYFWFHFFTKPNGLRTRTLDESDSHAIQALFKRDQAILPLQFKIPTLEKVFIIANQILDVAKNRYFTTMSVDYLLTTLLIELSQNYYLSIAGEPDSEEEARIDGIKSWIQANLSDHLKATDVAESFALNPHYLVRIFKQQTGQTVIQYINQRKLDQAKELLLRTNLPIKQIASMAFFTDEKRFMKTFKQHTNLTPSEFRGAYTRKFLDSSNFDPEVPITKNTAHYKNRFKSPTRKDVSQ
ncbi:helix-turn-helix transcriptional regulator [Levilactobacillus namurensis]|uniref:helix-turn-helix transcriptional regulator n=2 Tax=Levilactobacillus namurensis TaxID=380393 RepID=UPI000D302BEE|nr:AraC family transcriptional regulator [Levilactobacillus namurensis]MCW3778375.1 AraC family transcriptional regulator [Levilactobacillus namurensis]MDT7019708.1 AraC family transcriptional regulator [Levilactobacillus namurensis]PTM22877.1 AraC family transcriptional regulator [Lactobacillus sp. PFC-70]